MKRIRLNYYKKLYTSPNLKHLGAYKWRLAHGAGNLALWMITLPDNDRVSRPGSNQLELMHCANLHQKYYRDNPPFIIGLAEGRTQALELVGRIFQDCLDSTGTVDVKAFLFPEENMGKRPVSPKRLPVRDLRFVRETEYENVSGGLL